MFELWARRRPIEGRGFPYEFISNFEKEEYKYTIIDYLDKEIYQEAMITKDEVCIMYVEFDNVMTKKKRR